MILWSQITLKWHFLIQAWKFVFILYILGLKLAVAVWSLSIYYIERKLEADNHRVVLKHILWLQQTDIVDIVWLKQVQVIHLRCSLTFLKLTVKS
jgi:hypothetical protein